MKRLIGFLSVVFVSLFAWADGFGVNDKVLYFNSETLIAVIKNIFPQNLQLDVANKYVEVMDKSGNVSIADLITVCGVGKLDNAQCRNFINDLIASTGDNTIKPFYWADYVSMNPEPIRLQTYASGDGYHKNPGLAPGEWAMTFGWMKNAKFIQQYPQTKYIRGASACTSDAGTPYKIDAGKNYALNENTGEHCWCKMVGPEESPWVYNKGGDAMAGGCGRSCALECLSALRNEPMRAAMFSVVKLNGSNANTSDEKVIGDALIDEFKPCEFDWVNDTKWNNDDPWYGFLTTKKWPSEMPASMALRRYLEERLETKLLGDPYDHSPWYNDYNSKGLSNNGLQYEQWAVGGFNWMKSEAFQCKYPGVIKIKGVATCNKEKAKSKLAFGQTTNKNFIPNERTGFNCWCKMTYPEQSKWFYAFYWDPVWSADTTEPWIVEETTTQDGQLVAYEMHSENRRKPEEEIKLDFEADLDSCDSFCVGWCGRSFMYYEDYEMNTLGIFRSIGKK